MTSGYAPLGAMIASERLFEPFKQGTNYFAHGYTFGGHPVSAAVALANLDIFEREGLNAARAGERGRVPRHPGEAARPADRRRRPRRRLLLRDRAGQGQGHQGDVRRRRGRAAAARLPVQGAVRRRPVLPRRRPGRPGDPAGAAADHRADASSTRSSRSCAACSPRRGRSSSDAHACDAPGSSDRATRVRRIPEKAVADRAVLDAILDAGLVAHVAVVDDGQPFVAAGRLCARRRARTDPRLDRQPAVPRPRGRRADLPDRHPARRAGARALGVRVARCTTGRDGARQLHRAHRATRRTTRCERSPTTCCPAGGRTSAHRRARSSPRRGARAAARRVLA